MKLTICLEPVPLGRVRVNTKSHGRYLPEKSRRFMEGLKTLITVGRAGEEALECPLKVTLHFYKPVVPTGRVYGDIDNLAKAVLDACNGVIWKDDKQIVELHCFKHKGIGKIELEVVENEER